MKTQTEVKHAPKKLSDGSNVCAIDDCLCQGLGIDTRKIVEAKHTPTPWKAQFVGGDELDNPRWQIHDNRLAVAELIGRVGHRDLNREVEANAEFIVRAVNAHDELVAAIREVVDGATTCNRCDGTGKEPRDAKDACHNCGGSGEYRDASGLIPTLRAALAKAEGVR